MLADYFIFAIFQLRVRTLESPGELAVRASLAGIDLRSLGMHEQYGLQARRDGNRVGHVGRRFLRWRLVLCVRNQGCESENKKSGETHCFLHTILKSISVRC